MKRSRPTLRFSHQYVKMPKEFEVTSLVSCFICDRSELGALFVIYDTLYIENEQTFQYPLPEGKIIVLLLLTGSLESGYMWTTIRKWTTKKEKYYRDLIGHDFNILIEESPNALE